MTRIQNGFFVATLAALMLIGCGDAAENNDSGDLEVLGTFDTSFGSEETVTAEAWGSAAIVAFDNDANFAITQNAEDAEFSPSAFNKLVWTEPATDGSFYYCTVDFGLETQAAAEASEKTADDSDPDNSGCGGFSWTKLTPK